MLLNCDPNWQCFTWSQLHSHSHQCLLKEACCGERVESLVENSIDSIRFLLLYLLMIWSPLLLSLLSLLPFGPAWYWMKIRVHPIRLLVWLEYEDWLLYLYISLFLEVALELKPIVLANAHSSKIYNAFEFYSAGPWGNLSSSRILQHIVCYSKKAWLLAFYQL